MEKQKIATLKLRRKDEECFANRYILYRDCDGEIQIKKLFNFKKFIVNTSECLYVMWIVISYIETIMCKYSGLHAWNFFKILFG